MLSEGSAVSITISFVGAAEDDTVDRLHEFLQLEPELRGRSRSEAQPGRPGEMGGYADVLQVAVGSGGAITMLVASVATWLRMRRSNVRIQLRRGEVEVTLDAEHVRTASYAELDLTVRS